MEKLEKLIKESFAARREIKVDEKNDSNYRFINKKVYKELLLYSGDTLENVILNGRGEISIDEIDNTKALCLKTNTDIENISPRPMSNITIKLDNLNLTEYNRMSYEIYIDSVGYQNFYFHFLFGNETNLTNHAPSIYPNKWTYVTFECTDILRDKIEKLSITPFLMGTPPEALPDIKVYVRNIKAEVVDKEYEEGWDTEKRIAYCHSGYLPNFEKTAITNYKETDTFKVINKDTLKEYVFDILEEKSSLQDRPYYVLDFSSIKEEGTYYIEIDNRVTQEFLISDRCFDSSIYKSMNFLKSLQCGVEVEGVHSACHLNCQSVHPITKQAVPNHGGWHDAGDVSQFEICTAEMAEAILDLASSVNKDEVMYDRLLEEARVGLNWLLRTRFGDGHRAMAITYNIWRKNVLDPDNLTVKYCKSEEGSFENFLASAALAVGARLFKDKDEIFSNWCKRIAIDDYNHATREYENKIYTVRWGEPIESQTMGTKALAACELYTITNDEAYLKDAYLATKIVMICQEKENAPINGFFYEDQMHKYILAYEHRGHEQSPIQGIARLYELTNDELVKKELYTSLDLYRNYVLESVKYTNPYNLIPGHIYHLDKINIDHFTLRPSETKEYGLDVLRKQVVKGINLGNNWYLRIMPISITRRGFHATLLSKTKAVSMIAKVLNDQKLKQIVVNQIEWILGKNPFASSTMYGEGHNYHPLYVAFSRQMVGALPVGIKTKDEEDLPYWPTINNAVYKEIWGHTTGKYLWVLADILEKGNN